MPRVTPLIFSSTRGTEYMIVQAACHWTTMFILLETEVFLVKVFLERVVAISTQIFHRLVTLVYYTLLCGRCLFLACGCCLLRRGSSRPASPPPLSDMDACPDDLFSSELLLHSRTPFYEREDCFNS